LRLIAEPIGRAWQAPHFALSRVTLALHRAWALTLAPSYAALGVGGVTFALGWITHVWLLEGRALYIVVALGLVSSILRDVLVIILVHERGHWIRRGAVVHRDEKPLHYWSWTVAEIVGVGIHFVAFGWLIFKAATSA